VGETAFYRTKPDDDIGMRANGHRRFTRVLIGQGVDPYVRVIVFDIFGNGIYKANQRGGWTAFAIIEFFALLALTPVAGVVL